MGIWIKRVAQSALDGVAQVIDTLNTSVNEHTNAPSIHAVKEALDVKWTDIYPVGSIYMNITDVDPSELFGGTWEKIEDRFLLSCGTTYSTLGATGGSAKHTPAGTVGNHTLTTGEIPSHTHKYTKPTDSVAQIYEAQQQYSSGITTINTSTASANQDTGSAGTGGAHNHGFTGTEADTMPPYIVVNIWKRTA